jgi:gluconolactonase
MHRTANASSDQTSPIQNGAISVIASGLDHPECVIESDPVTLLAGGEDGQLYEIDIPSGAWTQRRAGRGLILGLTLDGDGAVWVCNPGNRSLNRVTSDGVRVVSSGSVGHPFTTPNYSAFTDQGHLIVSDSGNWQSDDGRLYVLDRDGRTDLWSVESVCFPNGLAVDPSGQWLYVAESTLPGISRVRILDDGSAGEREVVLELDGAVPDGLAFDTAGRLYIGCYRPDRVYRLDLDGCLHIVAEDSQGTHVAAPTNVALAADSGTLYFANFARWHVGAIAVQFAALRLRRPTELFRGSQSSGTDL